MHAEHRAAARWRANQPPDFSAEARPDSLEPASGRSDAVGQSTWSKFGIKQIIGRQAPADEFDAILNEMDRDSSTPATDGLTGLLNSGLAGDLRANDRAFHMVYAELRRSAQRQMRRGLDAATLSPTGLVHEVFLKLNDGVSRVNDRAHFYSLAARAMRQVLLDHQRDKQAIKRGGNLPHVELTSDPLGTGGDSIDHFAIEQALDALRRLDPRATQVVELHFYSGLNFLEIAELLEVSDKTARRDWDSARAFLLTRLSDAG